MITCPQCGTENREDARFCNRCGAALQRPLSTGPLPPNAVLQDRYQVVSLLGQGGMGAVYRARDTRLDVLVALKEMTPQPGLDPYTLAQLRQQFWQEAAVLARLDHSNLVRVTDFFEEGGNAYLVMNFVEGESLADRIEQQGAQPEDQVLGWAGQLLDALAHCHSQGIVHRDVKPQNVILRPDGRAVLVDFGLVKLWDPHDPRTKTAMRGMGTPEYAPPEQYDLGPGNTDPRSDVYSLGATMYHALTGQAPPTATQRIASRSAFRPPRVLNKHISPVTEVTVLRALELTMEDRFTTAQEMATALKTEAPPPPPPPPPPPKPRRTKVLRQTQASPVSRQKKQIPVRPWVVGGLVMAMLTVAAITAFLIMRPASPKRMTWGTVLFTSTRDGKQEIYRLTTDGESERVTNTPRAGESWSPIPEPGGTILFTSNRDGKREIYRLTTDGESERVTNTPRAGESWSPIPGPGGTILFTSNRDGKREIYRLTTDGESARVTNTPGASESWSPVPEPGGTILFTSNRDGKQEIYRLTGEGESARVTNTPGSGESWSPVPEPDGTILFTSNRDGKREIYRLTTDGESARVTNTPRAGESWSPVPEPGGTILFTSNRDGKREIYRLTRDGESEHVTNTRGSGESWLPD